jgi:hypothetical protein
MSSKEQWLQVDQDDHAGLLYYGIFNKAEYLDVGMFSGGLLLTFECNANNAWTVINPKIYTTVNGTLNFKLSLDTDYDDEIIKPSIVITSNVIGNISIKNNTRNELITINNCIVGEQIILDGNDGKINTTNGKLLDRWNKKFLKMQDGLNDITLTGGFSMKLSYKLPIRISG